MQIKTLEKRDYKKAIQYAIKGMHFNWYLSSEFLLKLYGRYFLYMELNRATQIIAAYDGDKLAGVLLAEIYGESPCCKSLGKQMYVAVFEWLQRVFVKDGVNSYDTANKDMLRDCRREHTLDGELLFLAADPESGRKGTGSLLLAELEKREKGKAVFLYTDNACTYQFYEHRGFIRYAEKNIELQLDKIVPLSCYLYFRKL